MGSENELNWNPEDFDSDNDSHGDNYGEYESDDLDEDDTGYPEFGFDEERYLFEYEPTDHVHYDPNYPGYSSSYQLVFTKTEMLSNLLGAWQKRSTSNSQGEFSNSEYSDLDMNLYQLRGEDRDKLRSFSVRKFLEVMGGEEQVLEFREKIDQVLIFTKKVLGSILARCLPMDMPYPAVRNILSHLMRDEGLHNVGYMSSDDEVEKVDERFHLSLLDDCVTFFYCYMKNVMFDSTSLKVPSSTMSYMKDMMKIFEKHLSELRLLAEKMDSDEKVGEIVTNEEGESEPE